MRPLELVRYVWPLLTGLGVIVTVCNFREALIDWQAVQQSDRRTVQVLQLQSQGAVWDQAFKAVALAALFVVGLVASPVQHEGHRSRRYVVAVGAMLANAGCLVTLSWMQNRRRHLISQALRLRSATKPPKET